MATDTTTVDAGFWRPSTLGDRVWVMGHAPGRIVREFKDVIPPTRDVDPLMVQESGPFKEAVAEVGRAFREVEAKR